MLVYTWQCVLVNNLLTRVQQFSKLSGTDFKWLVSSAVLIEGNTILAL